MGRQPALQYPLERVNVSAAAVLAAQRRHRHSRDPRVAPVDIDKTVSIVETCRFYGVADALTACRVPRSCQDCLAMSGCAVSYDGRCENVAAPWMEHAPNNEYTKALTQANPHGTAYNRTLTKDDEQYVFFAGNVKYCDASDAICSSCRATFQSLARSRSTVDTVRTQFCVGSGGCVCIGVCEVPELLASRVRDTECYGHESSQAVIPTLDPLPLPNFSSRRRDPRSPALPVKPRHVNASCAFYDELDMRGCRTPRSCRDCLEREGCVISGYKCVDAAIYSPAYDFREPQGKSNPNAFFPSSNTTYCSDDDTTCTSCRAEFAAKRAKANTGSDPTRYEYNGTFCVGNGGCVCIELCENPTFFLDKARDTECLRAEKHEINKGYYVMLGVLALVAVICHWGMLARDRNSSRRRDRPNAGQPTAAQLWRHMLDQAPQVLQLDLFGWRRYHQELLDKELELLAGAEDVSPVARPMGFDNTDPTAPEFDEDESSAPIVTNPAVLASAPAYGLTRRSLGSRSAPEPTAPDFDD